MTYTLSHNNIHIDDSYAIRKAYYGVVLDGIRAGITSNHLDCEVFEHRSMLSLKLEWAGHTLLYNLGYKREQTKDVDLDYPQTLKQRIGNALLGIVAYIVIK